MPEMEAFVIGERVLTRSSGGVGNNSAGSYVGVAHYLDGTARRGLFGTASGAIFILSSTASQLIYNGEISDFDTNFGLHKFEVRYGTAASGTALADSLRRSFSLEAQS
jgi:hypothetical protein